MAQYASRTEVSSDKSRLEIEKTLKRYGATSFAYGTDDEQGIAVIQFTMSSRQIRFTLPMPSRAEKRFTHHSTGPRTGSAADALYEQAIRQRWRALALVVKAKLEAVASGIAEFEQEFLAYVMLPGNVSVYESVKPGIEQSYLSGRVAPLLQIEGN